MLPIQIFNWISQSREEFHVLAAAAIVVLLVILLAMNSVAIWLRNQYQRRMVSANPEEERDDAPHVDRLPTFKITEAESMTQPNVGDPTRESRPLDPSPEGQSPDGTVRPQRARPRTTRVSETYVDAVFDIEDLRVFYGGYQAVRGMTLPIGQREITALIGPSGCGKSTFLRCFNRMNDLIPGARVEGKIRYHGEDLYADRRRPDRGAAPHRHGVPEAEPVPEVDLRQRRLRARASTA